MELTEHKHNWLQAYRTALTLVPTLKKQHELLHTQSISAPQSLRMAWVSLFCRVQESKWSAYVGVWQHALRGFIHEDISWNSKFKSPAKSAKCTHVWFSYKMKFLWKPERDKNYFLRSNNLFDYIHTIGVWNWQQYLLVILNCPIHTTAGKIG